MEWSYKDSYAVRNALLAIPTTSSTIVAQVDLKDFFLSGEDFDIAVTIASAFEDCGPSISCTACFVSSVDKSICSRHYPT